MAPRRSQVGIIMGSGSDSRVMAGAAEVLDEFGVGHEDQVVSAHRTPSLLHEYAEHADRSGFKAIIAGAGGAAHLPGMIASFTTVPVVGVPILVYNDRPGPGPGFSAFGGLDSLLSMSEMPTGSPVAVVGVNKAANAAIYALKILANESDAVRKRLKSYKSGRHRSVARESAEMRKVGLAEFSRRRAG